MKPIVIDVCEEEGHAEARILFTARCSTSD